MEKIEEIYKICEVSSTKLFIDEAFIEFTSKGFENSAINLGRECKNLFIKKIVVSLHASNIQERTN